MCVSFWPKQCIAAICRPFFLSPSPAAASLTGTLSRSPNSSHLSRSRVRRHTRTLTEVRCLAPDPPRGLAARPRRRTTRRPARPHTPTNPAGPPLASLFLCSSPDVHRVTMPELPPPSMAAIAQLRLPRAPLCIRSPLLLLSSPNAWSPMPLTSTTSDARTHTQERSPLHGASSLPHNPPLTSRAGEGEHALIFHPNLAEESSWPATQGEQVELVQGKEEAHGDGVARCCGGRRCCTKGRAQQHAARAEGGEAPKGEACRRGKERRR